MLTFHFTYFMSSELPVYIRFCRWIIRMESYLIALKMKIGTDNENEVDEEMKLRYDETT